MEVFYCLLLILFVGRSFGMTILASAPLPASPITNLTVVAGREARLPCIVEHHQEYKVAWTHYGSYGRAILAVGSHVLTKNPRVSVDAENGAWVLVLSNVTSLDQGDYVCQVNTNAFSKSVIALRVVVPPRIQHPPSDLVAQEGENVTFSCSATGDPRPLLTWKREDGREFRVNTDSVKEVTKSNLSLVSVTKEERGAYLCVASNGVPPAVSSRAQLSVKFSPIALKEGNMSFVWARVKEQVLLKCEFLAWPRPSVTWTKNGESLGITPLETFDLQGRGSSLILLASLSSQEFGHYYCSVVNEVGTATLIIALNEITTTTTTTSTTSTTAATTTTWPPPETDETSFPTYSLSTEDDWTLRRSTLREQWVPPFDLEDYDFQSNRTLFTKQTTEVSTAGPLFRFIQDSGDKNKTFSSFAKIVNISNILAGTVILSGSILIFFHDSLLPWNLLQ